MGAVTFTVLGEPCSGKNSRQIVTNRHTGRAMLIKSKKARQYVKDVAAQVQALSPPFSGPVKVKATLYYATERPDLDAELLIDCLQERIYVNDRQVREKHFIHRIDRQNPRAEVTVEPLQGDMLAAAG